MRTGRLIAAAVCDRRKNSPEKMLRSQSAATNLRIVVNAPKFKEHGRAFLPLNS